MKKIRFKLFILGLLLLFAYLLFWPVNIEPVAWTPPKRPALEGSFAPNDYLSKVEIISTAPYSGPEDVAVDSLGNIYVGVHEGKVLKYNAKGEAMRVFSETGGRPLGLHFDNEQNLIVADAYKGLLWVNRNGKPTPITQKADDLPFKFTNDLEIDNSDVIIFSDASHKYTVGNYKDDLLEHQGNGRLLAYSSLSMETVQLLDSLHFANGVAISEDGSFVLIVETAKYRILRYWLSGEKYKTTEVFVDNLPGFPDGISRGSNGIFWLAVMSPRSKLLDLLLPRPFFRKMVARLPDFLQPKPQDYAMVLGYNVNGELIHNLQDPKGKFSQITSVQEHNGFLYLGSLVRKAFARIPVPK